VTMPAYMYLVGDLGLAAQRAAGAAARARKAAAEGAETAAAATVPDEENPLLRRRKAKSTMLGRGHEYMDLDQELDYADSGPASDRSAGVIGFAGSAARADAGKPGGLATLPEDQYGASSSVPMLPSTWNQPSD
jgi:hypothetical protein